MIIISFIKSGDAITGFECKGHSMSAPSGQDIVCAAVSSACLMAANTVTEVIGLDADAAATDGYLRLNIKSSPQPAQDILNGLHLHLAELEAQYPENIKVKFTEE
ncbi:MAG: ribosomal-processing cysteine protease Prp [Eubacterium sp.]|nr:ribosomal-processing cysteine protease Prp [Eubacterium sp.]MBR0412447.1 ribosomal-processing cysteine protease Prp [Eubacterium sp.]